MNPRTRTIGAIGATVVTAGLVLGMSFAGSSAATGSTRPTPPTASMPMGQMPGMGSMMTGEMPGMGSMMTDDMSAMHSLMGSADMSVMHSMMHRMMKGTVADEILAECDTAHTAMAGSMATNTERSETQHELHHGGRGS